MVSMSCCKVGASLPSDPYGPCLVFLITSESSNTIVDGSSFICPTVGAKCSCRLTFGLTRWASSASNLPLFGALEQRSVETEGALPVDQTSTIKSVRAYEIIISFSL